MSVRGNHLGTEYRRSYKKSQYNCSATTYQQNLDFRREQKRRFVEHNPDPFDWDPEDIESDSGSDLSCRNQNRSSNRTHTQYKHEKLNQLYEKRLTDRQESSHSGAVVKKVHSNSQSKDFQPSNRSHQVVGRKEEMAYDDSGSESETSVVHVIEPEFVKKSSTKLSLPFADKQTQTERKSSKQEVKYSKHEVKHPNHEVKHPDHEVKHPNHELKHLPPGPFLPYGYEAHAVETGKKLTHNIRAAQEIYPSALRAQKLRKAKTDDTHPQVKSGQGLSGRNSQASECLQKTKSEPFRVFVHNEYSDDDDDNLNWVTEYDRNYQLYPEKEYRKNAINSRVHSREFIPRVLSNSQKSTRK